MPRGVPKAKTDDDQPGEVVAPTKADSPVDNYPEVPEGEQMMSEKDQAALDHNYKADSSTGLPIKK